MIPLAYNLRGLAVRRASTMASALGIAMVVFVLAVALMLSDGIRRTLGKGGRPDNSIVLRKGSDAEMASGIDLEALKLIAAAPGVKRGGDGKPLLVGEVVVMVIGEKADGKVSNVTIRGVAEGAASLRSELTVIEGRAPRPSTNEVMIGKRLRGRFKSFEIGQSFELRKNRPAQVVGIFSAGGSAYESEAWGSLDTIQTAFGREGYLSSIRVRLESATSFEGFQTYVEQDKRLGLDAMREPAYLEKQSESTSLFFGMMGGVIAFFFSMGAMIGAMITMYAAVSDRRREIGVLRAIGFSRIGILGSFLIESILLALLGGLVGVFGASLMGFVKVSTMNFDSWSEIVFSLTPTPPILLTALVAAGGMGILGGFLPALRASRVSPTVAMRG